MCGRRRFCARLWGSVRSRSLCRHAFYPGRTGGDRLAGQMESVHPGEELMNCGRFLSDGTMPLMKRCSTSAISISPTRTSIVVQGSSAELLELYKSLME